MFQSVNPGMGATEGGHGGDAKAKPKYHGGVDDERKSLAEGSASESEHSSDPDEGSVVVGEESFDVETVDDLINRAELDANQFDRDVDGILSKNRQKDLESQDYEINNTLKRFELGRSRRSSVASRRGSVSSSIASSYRDLASVRQSRHSELEAGAGAMSKGESSESIEVNLNVNNGAKNRHDGDWEAFQVSKTRNSAFEMSRVDFVYHPPQTKDLFFVKLVAGGIKRRYESLIVVEDKHKLKKPKRTGATTKVSYSYSDELLSAWAQGINNVQRMVQVPAAEQHSWNDMQKVHEKIIEEGAVCVAFASHVAWIMLTSTNRLMRDRTRFNIAVDQEEEDRRIIALMRAIKNSWGLLKPEIELQFAQYLS